MAADIPEDWADPEWRFIAAGSGFAAQGECASLVDSAAGQLRALMTDAATDRLASFMVSRSVEESEIP